MNLRTMNLRTLNLRMLNLRTRRRWSAALALLTVTALLLAACGGGQPAATPQATSPEATAAPAASNATTTTDASSAGTAGTIPGEAATGTTTETLPAEAAAQPTRPPVPTVPPPATVSEGEASKLEPAQRDAMYKAAPEMTIDPSKYYYATFKTDKGDIKVQLFADRAPIAVNNFVFLARDGFYNDTTFHRVLEGFMAQGGDPKGTGEGGPGYTFDLEVFPGAAFDRAGLLAMANTGQPNSNGSQFFLTFGPAEWLNGGYTIFGEVVEGKDVLDKLTLRNPDENPSFTGDKLYTVTIEESDSSTLPTPTPLPPTPTPFAPSSVKPADRPLAAVPLEQRANYFNTAPEMTIDKAKTYTATISTSQGDLVVALRADVAPNAVNNFVTLADLGFYDGTPVNAVSEGQLIVIGSPTTDTPSDAGYTIKPEVGLPLTPTVGSVAARSLGQDQTDGSVLASGSQLYIATSAPPADVNTAYSFFGQVVEGLDILPNLTVSDTIKTITIESK